MKGSAHFWVFILCLQLWCFIQHGDGQKCRTIDAVRQYRLVNHVLDTVNDISVASCTVLCSNNIKCYSINYLTTSKVCELNNKTKLWSPSGDFVQHEDCFYMDILARNYNPCAVEQPCRNNGTCRIVNHNNGTFRCECNGHYTGTQCERLAPLKSSKIF